MKLLALATSAFALVAGWSSGRPSLTIRPESVTPGDFVTARVRKAPPGQALLRIRSAEGRLVALRPPVFVDRRGTAILRVPAPNVSPGDYVVELVRRHRVLARGVGPLHVRAGPPGLRDCESSVYGELPRGWERDSLSAGPLWLVGAARAAGPRPSPGAPGYFGPIKFILVLENGVTATLQVAERDRRTVALLYARRGGLGEYRSARVIDGLSAVTFEGCEPSEAPHTQFNGGLLVAGPRCAHLEVHVRGRPELQELRIPFDRPCAD